eukprot:6177803-Pleurochrysis_carterae.AAC.3
MCLALFSTRSPHWPILYRCALPAPKQNGNFAQASWPMSLNMLLLAELELPLVPISFTAHGSM